MFLKKQSVQRDGRIYTYYRLVESYRDADGNARHRTIRYLGKLADEQIRLIREQLKKQNIDQAIIDQIIQGEYTTLEASATHVNDTDDHHTSTWSTSITSTSLPLWIPVSFTSLHFDAVNGQEWNVADGDTLFFVHQGQAEVTIRGRKMVMTSQQVLFCPDQTGMHIGSSDNQPLMLQRLVFRSNVTAATGLFPIDKMLSDSQSTPIMLQIQSPAEMLRLCNELENYNVNMTSPHAQQPITMLAMYRCFYELLHLIALETAAAKHDEHLSFQQMLQYVRAHFRDDLRRDELARKMGMTPEHFSRVFRSRQGCSFSDYLSRLRLHQARLELQLSQTSLEEIARRCGYSDVHYFSRKFRQHFGMPPRQYITAPKQYVSWNMPLTAMLLQLGIVPIAGQIDMEVLRHFPELVKLVEHAALQQAEDEHTQTDKQAHVASATNVENKTHALLPAPSLVLLQQRQPDLVFAYDDDPQSEQLHIYAPVQRLDIQHYNWRQQWLWLAERVQRSPQAQQWLQQWDTKLREARQQMQSWLERRETVGIYKIVSEKVYVYGNLRSMGGSLIYDGLHCEPPVQVRQQLIDTGRLNIEVSLEQLHHYAADHMIVIYYPMEHQNAAQYGTQRQTEVPVMTSPLWQQLPAVQSGQVHMMDRHLFYGFDPLSQQLQLQAWMDSIASYL
ncbi:AraC family transcriptional regulator [Paenibacillus hunanensis]|uniref:AraC-like DNA-binding protein/ABC-type Fe2+-enterobactin transport system substrate-binding protein n=1 Tax=Paenibacillus hunanensis TaxID=539262 RepID=A0ABU1IX89_9BACL|nr:AraC family transcriptional regulator [Paenibacillus hunanensis]MDR6243307.1 AraC-like DNA-binding protein/ABC-type Fe2+-enterobactin transport system substrate-binding protein [Paenibacillus hunanensis]GGI96829.1 hypothetical protein GCM10008022_01730 [Paenibacillus hunanensis]